MCGKYTELPDAYKSVIEAFIHSGVENDAKVDVLAKDGETPLYLATQNGHEACVNMLLSKKADVSKAADNEVTPLHIAACNGHADCLKALLVDGVKIVNQSIKMRVSVLSVILLNTEKK